MLSAALDLKLHNKLAQFRPYAKQREFFDLGATKKERMFNAGNQLGKSDSGAEETACHLTGRYPDWWQGRRFGHPTLAWACGMTAPKTMDINQLKLCGKPNTPNSLGTGLIPRECIGGDPVLGRGTIGAYASIPIKHVSGGYSTLAFKSYEQGWQKMQGDGVDFIWLDEEPDDFRVYTECQARLIATGGSLIITFTPLSGETELYQSFARGDDPDKGFVNMTGEDVLNEPVNHFVEQARRKAKEEGLILTEAQLREKAREKYERDMGSFPLHERAARRSGQPIMGSGSIFPIPRETIEIPAITEPLGHWRLGWGVDFGGMGGSSRKFSHPFGAVLGMYDPITDIIYIAHALQLKNMLPIQHADGMKRLCAGAPVFWPHDGHRRTADDSPETTASLYKGFGLRMWSDHATFKAGGYATETGIMEMQQRFTSGRLKVCTQLLDWWDEFISYHRDETGEIVKVHDDLMSATRILVMMLPRFGVGGVPMGNLQGQHWKDYMRRGVETQDGIQMARGIEFDLFTGQ
jgi:phage terminase large subunit-like protein